MGGALPCQASPDTSRHNAPGRSGPANVLALTMGDPCGIGPEIVAKLFREPDAAGCVVVGDTAVMRRAIRQNGDPLVVAVVEQADDVRRVPPRCVPVLQVDGLPPDLVEVPLG